MRPTKDEYYLNIARAVAARATCLKHKYGAVIVKNDRIVATGYNGAPSGETDCLERGFCYKESGALPVAEAARIHGTEWGTCVAVHAEQNAMLSASGEQMKGAVLYLACLDREDVEPCNICDRMIRNAGIVRVVKGAASDEI